MTKKRPDYNIILCRYSEIALKGKNRWRFEQKMIDRINRLLNKFSFLKVKKIRGRIVIHYHDYAVFNPEEIRIISEALTFVFGLDSFSFAIRCESNMDSIRKIVIDNSDSIINNAVLDRKTKKLTYRIRVKRSDKQFPMSTKEIEKDLADLIYPKNTAFTVNLNIADVTVYCEIHKKETFVFFDKKKGASGLPSGSNPPVLTLLSGGFDSSVASYMMMKRGVFVDFLTFHSHPFTPPATIEKTRRLATVLNKYQGDRRLFACNLLEVQKTICAETYETFRTIFYRRFMFRLAERIACKNGNKALVTGESVGQVASQTIINLGNIDNATEMLVLRPLVGMDKIEILRIAEKIGTFDISKEQVPDSCTVFSPSNPSTGASRKMILSGESRLDVDALVDTAYKNTVMINIETGKEIPLATAFLTDK
jgi:tRNA uracil 4-sulfurtransferase